MRPKAAIIGPKRVICPTKAAGLFAKAATTRVVARTNPAHASSIDHHLSALRRCETGEHADRCLSVLLCMHRLWHKAKAEVGRLLRILFLRLSAVSTNPGSALRRTGCCVLPSVRAMATAQFTAQRPILALTKDMKVLRGNPPLSTGQNRASATSSTPARAYQREQMHPGEIRCVQIH